MQKAFGKKSVIFLFIFPAFLIYTAFVIVSIVWAGYYSFFDWSGVGEKVFVGLKNYIELLTQDEVFRATVWHTLIYTVINVAIQVFGGLLFAILLSSAMLLCFLYSSFPIHFHMRQSVCQADIRNPLRYVTLHRITDPQGTYLIW